MKHHILPRERLQKPTSFIKAFLLNTKQVLLSFSHLDSGGGLYRLIISDTSWKVQCIGKYAIDGTVSTV